MFTYLDNGNALLNRTRKRERKSVVDFVYFCFCFLFVCCCFYLENRDKETPECESRLVGLNDFLFSSNMDNVNIFKVRLSRCVYWHM